MNRMLQSRRFLSCYKSPLVSVVSSSAGFSKRSIGGHGGSGLLVAARVSASEKAPPLAIPSETSQALTPPSNPLMNRMLQSRRFLSCYKSPLVSVVSSSSGFSKRSIGGHGGSGCWIFKMPHDHVKVSPVRRFSDGFSSCSAFQDLTGKKCVPCNSKDMQPMSEQSANELCQQVQGWNLVSEGCTMKLHRSWKVKSFTKGLEFFNLIADIAEAEGHHPDLHLVGWNNVKIEIWTHSVGGLTENDFILAAKINSLNMDHLLRKKSTA